MQVRCEASLGFQGGEVLDVPADRAAQVLKEPVDQLREVQRVPRGAPVVVRVRVDGDAVGVHPPVAVTGQGEEQRGLPHDAVRCGERPPDGAPLHRQPGEIRHVLPPLRGPHPPRTLPLLRRRLPAHAERGQLRVHLADQLVDLAHAGRVVRRASHPRPADGTSMRAARPWSRLLRPPGARSVSWA